MTRLGGALSICLLVWLSSSTMSVLAEDAAGEERKYGWFHTLDLNLVVTTGNSDTDTLGIKNVGTRQWPKAKLVTKFDAVRSDTDDDTFLLIEPGITFFPGEEPVDFETVVVEPPKELDVEKFFAESRYTRDMSRNRTWNTGLSWDRNEDAGILNRAIFFGGIGHRWKDTDEFKLESGYGISLTDREEDAPDPEKEERFAGVRLTLDLDWQAAESTKLSTDFTGNVNLEDAEDYSVDTTVRVEVKMTDLLSLSVSMQLLYNAEPGLEDVDVLARVDIIDPDGVPGSGDEFFETVAEGGAEITVREDRNRLAGLDTVFRTSLVISF